jgi:branched-chain amino acid transport system permease protein
MQNDIRSKAVFVGLAFLALAVYPLMAGNFGVDLVTKIMVYAIFALSLELLVGGTGLVCFGHAAFFGIGAYGIAISSSRMGPGWDAVGLGLAAALGLSLLVVIGEARVHAHGRGLLLVPSSGGGGG